MLASEVTVVNGILVKCLPTLPYLNTYNLLIILCGQNRGRFSSKVSFLEPTICSQKTNGSY